MIWHRITYLTLRICTFPLALLPFSVIHKLGIPFGTILYHLYPKLRKRALSNLALITEPKLTPEQIRNIAKKAIQNLLITCMEYPKLSFSKDLSTLISCDNPDLPRPILNEGKGAIFYCGHQANWELLFLDSTSRFRGVAIGRSIKNPYLYRWIVRIREKTGGTLIPPKSALKESLRAISQGKFIGIVGDQGMPDSGFSSPFFGALAWTSPLPALLAYRTGRPIIVCTLYRSRGKYFTHYSDPIRPNREKTMEQEIPTLMHKALRELQESIKKHLDQWLWTHNRWKQQLPSALKKPYRHDTIAIILSDPADLSYLSTFRAIYPTERITLFVPRTFPQTPDTFTRISYSTSEELLHSQHFQKLVFNFTSNLKLNKHFRSLAAFTVVNKKDLDLDNLSSTLQGSAHAR